jgi:hypothetical protein
MNNKIFHYTTSYSRLSLGILDRLENLASADHNFEPVVITSARFINTANHSHIQFQCLSQNILILFLCLAFSIFRNCAKHKGATIVVRYSPSAIYLWPIYVLFPYVIWEFHGLPFYETCNRKNYALRSLVLTIEKNLLSLHPRRYLAITRQIATHITENYQPKQVVICPNTMGFPNYHNKALSLLKHRKNLYSNHVNQSNQSRNLNILFLASNLSQPWQGLDIASKFIKKFCYYNSRISLHLDIFGDNMPATLQAQLQSDMQSIANYSLSINSLKQDLVHTFFQGYDLSLGPCALLRKNLTSSASLKTRSCLINGLPVASNYPDDAFNSSFKLSLDSLKSLCFFRFNSDDEFQRILLHILHLKYTYPVSYNARFFLIAKNYLNILPSNLISRFH